MAINSPYSKVRTVPISSVPWCLTYGTVFTDQNIVHIRQLVIYHIIKQGYLLKILYFLESLPILIEL